MVNFVAYSNHHHQSYVTLEKNLYYNVSFIQNKATESIKVYQGLLM